MPPMSASLGTRAESLGEQSLEDAVGPLLNSEMSTFIDAFFLLLAITSVKHVLRLLDSESKQATKLSS